MNREQIINQYISVYEGHAMEKEELEIMLNRFADDIVNNLQPSLPTNLDEAAEKYAKPYHDKMAVVKGFKAGAEWMAGHGETFDGIVRDDGFVDFDKYGSSMMIPSNTTCLKNGDKVKIIIVKEEK